jgi:hypothetical protein
MKVVKITKDNTTTKPLNQNRMEKIPTAEEFFNDIKYVTYSTEEKLITFAKLHVEAALKEAINNVRIIDDPNSYCGNTGSEYPPDQILDTDAILNSYPLENIK